MSVSDLGAARFKAADKACDIGPRDVASELIRLLGSDEVNLESVIVIGLDVDPADGGSSIHMLHGGPASTNERLGMLARATAAMIDHC